MRWRPRSLRLLLVIYAAVLGYALVAWMPAIVDRYDRLTETHPNWAYAYLGVVAVGALLLGGASIAFFWRVWQNSAAKGRRRAARLRDPSQLTPAERERELADNLASSRELADDEETAQALRDQLKAQLLALQAKHSEQRLEIVAFGTISSGKSTLLNALAGREAFAADVVGGTTAHRCEIPWPGADRVVLVDTPGLAEVRGEARASLAADAAKNADLVLLVVDGPLKSFEVELAERLLAMEKRLLACLNKEDWYEPAEARDLVAQIAEQLPRIAAADVVAVRAASPRANASACCPTVARNRNSSRSLPTSVRSRSGCSRFCVATVATCCWPTSYCSRAAWSTTRSSKFASIWTSGPTRSSLATCGRRAARRA